MKDIKGIIIALNASNGIFKYPLGNEKLTDIVKALESKGLIYFSPHYNKWFIN